MEVEMQAAASSSSSTSSSSSSQPTIDEALYSRLLYVVGREGMLRMATTRVLLCGLSGLGVEIAKNIILSGVKSVTLHDNAVVSYTDLSAQFYLSEEDVGKSRVESCVAKLASLNHHVTVTPHMGSIDEAFLRDFDIVVVTNTPHAMAVEWNDICRRNGTRFIMAEVRGVFANVFCDFGDDFTVYDLNGEEPAFGLVTSISNDAEATVSVPEDHRHGLEDGDVVSFTNVEGMSEINGLTFRVKVTGPETFTIGDTRQYSTYVGGGYYQQIKQPQILHFKSLREMLESPSFSVCDYGKMDRPPLLHMAFHALHQFQMANNLLLPNPSSAEEMEAVLANARAMATTEQPLGEQGEKLTRLLARTAAGNLSAMCAFVGGVASQEVLKASSGKYEPIRQFLYFDAIECLPDDILTQPVSVTVDLMQVPPPVPADASPPRENAHRYEGQEVIFGRAVQEKMENLRYFIVGAGALGCEFLKMFAMMGIGCGPEGHVVVTDMDQIELSNLSRQFLFRTEHLKMSKSAVAAQATREMNPAIRINAMQDKVAPDTERLFNDDFWQSLDGVCNALDNVEARRYVDSKCVEHGLSLLESGTLGTKANVQVVVPHLTESYGSSSDPPEKSVPICTLKNFPSAIEHTLQWARGKFEDYFVQAPSDVNRYVSKPDFLKSFSGKPADLATVVSNLHSMLLSERAVTFEDCVRWARMRFEELFTNTLLQLLHSFPLDATTSTGQPFWGGTKRPPTPLRFDPNDEMHMAFIVAAANLHAVNYRLHGTADPAEIRVMLARIEPTIPRFTPSANVKIATTEQEAASETSADEQAVQAMLRDLPTPDRLAGFELTPQEFEKDDDTNFHMDFITATSNLRARSYKIPEADKQRSKLIAGKIIPAMVTTTALVTGLVGLELYKLVLKKRLDDFKNAFLNTAISYYDFSTPVQPPSFKYNDTAWNMWDYIKVSEGRDITLGEFLQVLQRQYGLEVQMLTSGKAIIYSFFMNAAKKKDALVTPLARLVQTVSGVPLRDDQHYIQFVCMASDAKGDDAEVPTIRYYYK